MALPERIENREYGMFGYTGWCCDNSIRNDRVENVAECISRGYMAKDTQTFDGYKMVRYARMFGSENVAKFLVERGWEDESYSGPVRR